MNPSGKYKEAADEYVSRGELRQTTANQDDVNNAPMRPPRNIAPTKFNTTTALDRSTGSGHRSSSKDHDSASNDDIITANQDDVSNAPMRPPRNIAPTKFNTTTALDRSTGSRHRSSSKDHDSASNDDLNFEEYLKKQGVKESTIQKLEDEEICDLDTLQKLSEDDINGLGLKTGQKAIIRNLILKGFSSESATTSEDNVDSGGVELNYYCLQTDGKGKVVAEITTKHQYKVNPIKSRILLLVDISGSMGIKTGKRRRYSKLYRIKGFAKNMVTSLDDGDFAGLVTFGETANVLLPMTEIKAESRDDLKTKLDTLDKCFLSTKTNLSAGLSKALEVFRDASSRKHDLLDYRNSIIIFSDGEINAGTQEPSKLVHEVREKIRQLSYGLDESLNQWASISTVVLGKSASEAMYCLSKFCSSDAFYSIDMDVDKDSTETELSLPVLLRKAAVAWNVSVHIESINGAILRNDECTQDNKVRILGQSARGPKTVKAYFYYDIPGGSTKHIGIGLDLEDAYEEEVLKITVEYSGFSGKRETIIKTVTKSEIFLENEAKRGKAIAEHYKNDARMLSEEVLGKAAKNAISGRTDQSAADIEEGKSSLQKLLNKYGDMAKAKKEESSNTNIIDYAKSLMNNMDSLLQIVQTKNDDDVDDHAEKSWLKIKAVSSAITRETPNLLETVADSSVLCPIPEVRSVSSVPAKQQSVRASDFFDFEDAINELKASIKKE